MSPMYRDEVLVTCGGTARNEGNAIMNYSAESLLSGNGMLPEGANIFSRKVARSGHISYEGHPYFISKAVVS